MALASWNAVPGDATYSWKTSLEGVLLAVLPSDKLKSATNSKLTERRMGEVSKVLSGTHASEGLNNLSAQVLTTKESLRKINNAQDRAVAVALYIQTLNEVNSQLETEKQSRAVAYLPPQQADTSQFSIKNLRRPTPVTTNNNTNTNQTVTTSPPNNYAPPSTTQPTQRPIGQLSQPVITQPTQTTQPSPTTQPVITQPTQQPTQQPNPTQPTSPLEPTEEELINEEVSEEIGQTQEEINEVIHELEDIIEEAEQESAAATGAPPQQPGQSESQQQQREVREEERQQRQENQNNGREQSEQTEQESSNNEEGGRRHSV